MQWKATVLLLVTSSAMLTLSACTGSSGGDAQEIALRTAPPLPTDTKDNTPSTTGTVDADAAEEFMQTESGLKYRIRRKSNGKKPAATDTVVAHYRGWLDDGTEFDSSYKSGQPIPFPLNGVIKGWTEGLQLIGEGGMIELEIPSELGYGAAGSPGSIPPNATLHFTVELIEVK